MLLVENGHVLAALDIVSKERVHAGRRCSAGGLSTVVTRQQARGRGHGRRHLVASASPSDGDAAPGGAQHAATVAVAGSAAVAVTINIPLAQASEVAPHLGLEDARV
jgi:hypothetical protein